MKIFFYDLETTGIDYKINGIIQLGGIVCDLETDGKLVPIDGINLQMQPKDGKKVDLLALEVNGISIEKIQSYMKQEDAFKKFTKFLEKHVDKFNKLDKLKLAGYNNTSFDNDFLRQWFIDNGNKYYGAYFWPDCIDVMCEVSRYLFYYRPILTNFTLGNIGNVLGISTKNEGLHDALYDIKLTFKIFKKLLEEGKRVLEFDEDKAVALFKQQKETKELFTKPFVDLDNSKTIVWSEV